MSATATDQDPLWRLVDFERRHQLGEPSSTARMGYSPSLDGLRAISVVAVILYHVGFGWAKGGFYGVEVFFVVSGFLITSLLLEERERDDRISLRGFWARRARRLLPALFTMLVAVSLWAWMFGTAEQQTQLRRDLPWSIFYVANWGQIFGKAAYYSPVDPPLLRHMWSLAVEEQWYLVWPLVFIGLAALAWSRRTTGTVLVGVFLAIWLWMWWLTRDGLAATVSLPDPFGGGTAVADRTNVLYLSTFTRAGGLLLGAGAAYLWRPWRRPRAPDDHVQLIEAYGMGAIVGLLIVFGTAELTEPYTFQWLLPLVSLLSVIAVAAAVHPQAYLVRGLLSWKPLVEIGRRSYGLYLWHWPIFVFVGVDHHHLGSVIWAGLLTVAVSEACYRFIETPIRKGSIQRFHPAPARASSRIDHSTPCRRGSSSSPCPPCSSSRSPPTTCRCNDSTVRPAAPTRASCCPRRRQPVRGPDVDRCDERRADDLRRRCADVDRTRHDHQRTGKRAAAAADGARR